MTWKQLKDLDTKLQVIVDTVRTPKGQVLRAIGGLIPTELHCMPTGLSDAEKGRLEILSTRPRTGEETEESIPPCDGESKNMGTTELVEELNIAYK